MVYRLKSFFVSNQFREYNFFKELNIFKKSTSGKVAKERLKFLLVSDRAGCSPEMLDMIRKDVINVISKYIDIDKEEATIRIEKNTTPYLFANIPIKEVKYK